MSDKCIAEMWKEQELEYRPTSPTYPPDSPTWRRQQAAEKEAKLERNRAARRAAEAAQPRQEDTRSEFEKFEGYLRSRELCVDDAYDLLEEYGTLDNMYHVLGWPNPSRSDRGSISERAKRVKRREAAKQKSPPDNELFVETRKEQGKPRAASAPKERRHIHYTYLLD